MITQIHLVLADRFGVLYWFEKRGEGLPLHTHRGFGAELAHDVLCTAGRLQVVLEMGAAVRVQVLDQGEHLALADVPHEIAALEDGSSFLGIFHHGRPRSYALLPEGERCSRYASGELVYPLNEGKRDDHTQAQPGAAR